MLVCEISAGQDDRPKWFAASQASISAGHMAGDQPVIISPEYYCFRLKHTIRN